MFGLSEYHKYYLYRQPADMRKGFDGLSGLVRDGLGRDPLDGSVYLFVNRNRDKMKLLIWSDGGFVLYYKRLESGTFELPGGPQTTTINVTWETMVLMIQGIRFEKIIRKKRYSRA